MLDIVDSTAPPEHLILGSDALGLVRDQLARWSAKIDAWEALSRSTDN